MHVVIIGAGNFGSNLAHSLFELGHDISVVDRNPAAIARVQDLSREALVGDVTNRTVLEEASAASADAVVVSLGDHLGSSILVTLHLKEMEAGRIVAKAISPEHEKILERIGAHQVIFPERDAAHRLALALGHPNLLEYLPLSDEFSVAELQPPESMVGKSLLDLGLRSTYKVNVIAVKEQNSKHINLVLDPAYVVRASDHLVVAGRHEDLDRLRKAT